MVEPLPTVEQARQHFKWSAPLINATRETRHSKALEALMAQVHA